MDRNEHEAAAEAEPLLSHSNLQNGVEDGDEIATISQSRLKLVATTFDFWITGVAVAAVGIEHYYNTSDATTAFIFPANLLGYLIATALIEPSRARFGLRGIAIISPLLRLCAGLVIASGPAFPILLLVYVVFGLGGGLTDMAWNNWASSMSRPNVAQGLLHGSFSIGCIVGPILAVAMLKSHAWYVLYLVLAAMAGVELLLQPFAFRNEAPPAKTTLPAADVDTTTESSPLQSPSLWLCALFFFIYQGIEAAFTDWIVVYMRRVRHMDSALAGMSSSIFWTGMALGRYLLGPISDRIGARLAITIYIIVAIIFQACLGLVRNDSASLVFLGLNGFMIAPLYPAGIVVLVSRLPKRSQLSAVALAMGLGQMGAAVAPLGIGFMATRLGIQHLMAVVCGLSVVMLISWAVFAKWRA